MVATTLRVGSFFALLGLLASTTEAHVEFTTGETLVILITAIIKWDMGMGEISS